jgi:small subunit ribosomal protein S19
MSRSKWKGPYINEELFDILKKKLNNNTIITTKSRNSEIISNFIGLTFDIHTGKNFLKIEITEEMLGHKFGEFAFTRTHSLPKKIKKKISFKKKTIKK